MLVKQRAATTRSNFTAPALKKLPIPKQGRVTVYDAKSNLGLRVDSNGMKSFFWFKTGPGGKAIFRSLGTFPSTLIEDARAEANRLQGVLEAWRRKNYQGTDPFESPKAEYTFGELVDSYLEKHVANHAAHPDRAKQEIQWMIGDGKPRKKRTAS